MIKGIDISQWQGSVDVEKVKASGIQFVILREGFRASMDMNFEKYVIGAGKAGIPILGVYHFLYTDGANPVMNARSTYGNLQYVGMDPTDTWIFCDIEDDTWKKNGQTCTKDRCTQYVKEFLDELVRLGCRKLGIYTNNDYYVRCLNWSVLGDYIDKIWLADYTGGPDRPCIIQQTSESGSVNGISGTVDTDVIIDERIAEGIIEASTATGNVSSGVTAEDILAVFRSWIGMSKADRTHLPILQIYNDYVRSHPGTGRGYIVQPTDQYCDTGFSAAFISLDAVNLIGGVECGVEEHVKIFREAGIWEEDGSVVPEKGWGIVYNWDTTVQPNVGYADHIGIVYDVVDGQIYCYECNISGGKVGIRRIPVGYGCIRGFCKPKYAQSSSGSASSSKEETSTETLPTIRRGSKGTAVRTLQEYLIQLGYTLECDGDFGPATEGAVTGFQKLCGDIEVDGVVGQKTWSKLKSLISSKQPSKNPKWVGSINPPPLPVRKSADPNAGLMEGWPYLAHGNLVDVCDEVTGSDGRPWYYVRIAETYFGYVPWEYVEPTCGDACEITG